MLNELPKKPKKPKKPVRLTRARLFWRVQKECLRRSVTVYLMYLFMSLLMLASQAAGPGSTVAIVVGCVCIAGGVFFNAHLCYHFGIDHYDAYLTGCIHRRNRLEGIESGGDHREEREFRVWKGFLIGLYSGIVVIVLGLIAGSLPADSLRGSGGFAYYALVMFAGWAIIPITWFGSAETGLAVSAYWSIALVLIPILVSGSFYLLGAMVEKKRKQRETEQAAAVAEAAERAKHQVRVQTEEQRRKTLQSKKKK